jgi:hypothetical protein
VVLSQTGGRRRTQYRAAFHFSPQEPRVRSAGPENAPRTVLRSEDSAGGPKIVWCIGTIHLGSIVSALPNPKAKPKTSFDHSKASTATEKIPQHPPSQNRHPPHCFNPRTDVSALLTLEHQNKETSHDTCCCLTGPDRRCRKSPEAFPTKLQRLRLCHSRPASAH